MACFLFGAKSVPDLMIYIQLDPLEETSVKFAYPYPNS